MPSFLSPADRAAFAVTSRLLACFITESLLKAFFVPINSDIVVGACVLLSKRASCALFHVKKHHNLADDVALVLLRTTPILKPGTDASLYRDIALIDPLDMIPQIYGLREDSNELSQKPNFPAVNISGLPLPRNIFTEHTTLSLVLDPLHWWNRFSVNLGIDHSTNEIIAEELRSSVLWQKHAYENCRLRPTFASPSVEWEHALVEGHPTHPMHRARQTLPPIPTILPGQYNFHQPRVRFALIPRESLYVQGDFEALLTPLRTAAAFNARRQLEIPEGHFLLPVHELQMANIKTYFSDAAVLPEEFSIITPAQASLRTVTLPCAPHLTLKLAMGLKISSALRTISHFTAYAGPRFGANVVPKLAINRTVLKIENEVASAVYKHADPEVAKHCTAVVREMYSGDANGEQVILAAALMETWCDRGEEPAVVVTLKLDTEGKRFAFLARYIDLIFDAFLPPLLKNGVAFEAHGQNTLARFDRASGQLLGFVFRDFGGLRIHRETLRASTGVEVDTLPGHCIVVTDVHDAYKRLYHTLIYSHLHRLIRVLGFHHDGRGWARVRESLKARVPRGSALWRAWLDPERTMVMGKCLLRMKLEGSYRDAIYEAMPNLIQFRQQDTKVA